MFRSFISGYDDNVNPDAANAWTTAAFRFGHSQIQSNLTLFNAWFQQVGTIPLSTVSVDLSPGRVLNAQDFS